MTSLIIQSREEHRNISSQKPMAYSKIWGLDAENSGRKSVSITQESNKMIMTVPAKPLPVQKLLEF